MSLCQIVCVYVRSLANLDLTIACILHVVCDKIVLCVTFVGNMCSWFCKCTYTHSYFFKKLGNNVCTQIYLYWVPTQQPSHWAGNGETINLIGPLEFNRQMFFCLCFWIFSMLNNSICNTASLVASWYFLSIEFQRRPGGHDEFPQFLFRSPSVYSTLHIVFGSRWK